MTHRFYRQLFFSHCRRLTDGWIQVHDVDGVVSFGDPRSQLRVQVHVHRMEFYRQAVLGGGLGAAESLMNGEWTCDDLTSLVRIFIRNLDVSDRMDRGVATLRAFIARISHWMRRNHRRGAVRNIHRHYDLGNEFFQLMLDETMNYSCLFFERPDSTLNEAASAKMDRVCQKLALRSTDHLLEIGTGWGGLAIHAAQNYGCRVTTTTISKEQFEYAQRKINQIGLNEQVTVLLCDYRDLQGRFDKLVSIEMIEAVGAEYFDTFFRKCAALLKPTGLMLMQAIAISQHRYTHHLRSVEFIRKYIFPGGCLPSVLALSESAATARMRLVHLEEFTKHYARTLRCWRENFYRHLPEIRRQGYDDRFIRMWEYYLCYSEATFAERQTASVQIMFAGQAAYYDAIVNEQAMSGKSRPAGERPAVSLSKARQQPCEEVVS